MPGIYATPRELHTELIGACLVASSLHMHGGQTHNEAQQDGRYECVCEAGDADHPPLKAAETCPPPVEKVIDCEGAYVWRCRQGGNEEMAHEQGWQTPGSGNSSRFTGSGALAAGASKAPPVDSPTISIYNRPRER